MHISLFLHLIVLKFICPDRTAKNAQEQAVICVGITESMTYSVDVTKCKLSPIKVQLSCGTKLVYCSINRSVCVILGCSYVGFMKSESTCDVFMIVG